MWHIYGAVNRLVSDMGDCRYTTDGEGKTWAAAGAGESVVAVAAKDKYLEAKNATCIAEQLLACEGHYLTTCDRRAKAKALHGLLKEQVKGLLQKVRHAKCLKK